MISAPIPPNEAARLEAFKRYAILDTPPEAIFDRITRLAARHFEAPIALISLIDHKRQWFKSCVGMNAGEVDREIAFCAHAILSDDVLIVPDTLDDPRFFDNPQVIAAPFIRFYAGAPLVTPDGFRLGTLCIVDTVPRSFTPSQAADLCDFAAMVIETLETRRATAPMAAAIESTASGVVICDPNQPDAPIVFVNEAFCMMTGYSQGEVLGRNCRFLQGPDTDPDIIAQMRKAVVEQKPFRGSVLNYRKDRTSFWNSLHINPVFDDFGELVSFVGVQVDTTAQVEALEQARQSTARLSLAQHVAQLGSWECSFTASGEVDEKSVLWSDETYRLLGLTPGEPVNLWKHFFKCVHPDDLTSMYAGVADAIRGLHRYNLDHRLVRPDGIKRVVHEEGDIILDEQTGRPLRFVGIMQDITDRIFAADVGRHLTEARELPEMLRRCTQSMVDHLDAAFARIWTFNERDDVLELRASSGIYTHLDGAHGRVPMGQFKIGRIASERQPHLTNQVLGDPWVPEQAWAREQGMVAFAGYPLIVDNRLVGVMAMFSRHPLSQKTLAAMAPVATHIALGIERKLAEVDAEQLAAIVECSGDAIIGMSLEGIITSWNRGAQMLFGFGEKEAVGQSSLRLIVPPDRHEEEVNMLLKTSHSEHVPTFETVRLQKEGPPIHVSLTISAIRDAAGAVVAYSTISRDITARKMADDALRVSEENYRALFDTTPLPSWIVDLSTLAFLEVNQAAIAHYGYSREEFLAMKLPAIRLPDQHSAVLADFQMASSRTWLGQRQHQTKNGSMIEVEISSVVITFAGRPARLAVINDVTERLRTEQALRKSEARYQRIAANVPGMVYQRVLRTDGSIVYPFVSEGSREVFGLEPQKVQEDAQQLWEMIHPEDRVSLRKSIMDSARLLQPWSWQGRIVRPGTGEIRCIQGASRPELQANGDIVWDGVVMDITERKQAEEDRRAKEEAERANQAKSQFLSRMSHELRTPLNAILGFGQLLEFSSLDEQDSDSVKQILNGGHHLLGLIDEVLDLSRAETGELRLVLGKVDLDDLLYDCVDLVDRLAEKRNVTCKVKRPHRRQTSLWCDEQRVRQILLNLLSNAIKYNREGGQVIVSSEPTPAGKLRINVTDTGPGISAADIARLFVPFERLDQQYSEVEGTGLGLVVSKRIAEAMGSDLGVESEIGCGSTFWIEVMLTADQTLPPAEVAPPTVSPAPSLEEPLPATLLYIEDNLSNLQFVQMLFAQQRPQWRILSALNGESGIAQAQQQVPDLILLDLQLPGMPGEAVLEALRHDSGTSHIPLIVLSADATSHSRERLLAKGADGYVTKPFKVKAILELLDRALTKNGTEAGANGNASSAMAVSGKG